MPEIAFEVFAICMLVAINGVFAMSKLAVVTARKSRLQAMVEAGDAKAKAALELAQSPNRFLSAVQIGITLIGIFAGAFGGRTLADRLAAYFALIPALQPYSQAFALAVVVLAITYLSLVFGELVPKRLALRQPERIAAAMAVPLTWFSKIASPIIYLLSISTDFVIRLFGAHHAREPAVTDDDVRALIRQGTEAGVFAQSEQDLFEAVIELGDRSVRTIMTPRKHIVWLDVRNPIEENLRQVIESGYSRFPVAAEDLDHVLGIVQVKDTLPACWSGKPLDLTTLIQEPLFVPRTVKPLQTLESFRHSGKHIALVVDEYGGIEGLITHHDILEAIAGDMPLDDQHAGPMAVQREDGSWLIDGMLPVDELKEIFHLESLPGEKEGTYETLGGFVLAQMGRIPSVSDYFEWNGLRFEVVDMDGKRIDKVLVTRPT